MTLKAGTIVSTGTPAGVGMGMDPPTFLKPGDVVSIPPEVKHWHGAAADSWFQHIALAVPAEGASAEWLEPVDAQTYERLG